MKKTIIKITVAALAAISALCFAGCSEVDYSKYDEVERGVDYAITALSSYGASTYIPETPAHIRYAQVSEELLGKSPDWYEYAYNIRTQGNRIYWLYSYEVTGDPDQTGGRHEGDPLSVRESVGLLCADLATGECMLVYDFKDVYRHRSAYTQGADIPLYRIADETHLIFTRDGMWQVYDLISREITFEREIYDPEEYAGADTSHYIYHTDASLGGDFFIDGIYYEFRDGAYFSHEIPWCTDENAEDIYKSGQYVYSETEQKAYDLAADAEADFDEAAAEAEQQTESADAVTHEGKTYTAGENSPVLYDEEGNTVITFTEEYMSSHCDVYDELNVLWDSDGELRAPPEYLRVADNKVFVICHYIEGLGFLYTTSPAFIFEYDMETGELYYAGCHIGDVSYIRINGLS